MSTLPTKLYAVAIVGEGVVYSRVIGPYTRRAAALKARDTLPDVHRWTIISTPLIWNGDTE